MKFIITLFKIIIKSICLTALFNFILFRRGLLWNYHRFYFRGLAIDIPDGTFFQDKQGVFLWNILMTFNVNLLILYNIYTVFIVNFSSFFVKFINWIRLIALILQIGKAIILFIKRIAFLQIALISPIKFMLFTNQAFLANFTGVFREYQILDCEFIKFSLLTNNSCFDCSLF